MIITFYHNPRCSKSRAVSEILSVHQIDARVIEYLKVPFSANILHQIIAALDVPAAQLVRIADAEYAGFGMDPGGLDAEKVVEVLLQKPALFQRPVVVVDDQARICRPPERVLELIK